MSKKALQSSFEFTGNTSSDGTHTYNQFIQRDNRGREISVSQANAMYCRNLTTKEDVALGDASVLLFRADQPQGDYLFETKLKDGRVFQGHITQVLPAEEKQPADHVALGDEQNKIEEVETPEPTDETSAQDGEDADHEDESNDNQSESTPPSDESQDQPDEHEGEDGDQPSSEEDQVEKQDSEDAQPQGDAVEDTEEKADEESKEPTPDEVSEQSLEEQYAQPVTLGEGDVQHYTIVAGGETITPEGDVNAVFDAAFEELLNSNEVAVCRGEETIATLTRLHANGQVSVSCDTHAELNVEEETAAKRTGRRLLTGIIRN